MTTAEIVGLITGIASICSIVFGYIGYQKGLKKECNESGNESGKIKANIEYIVRGIDRISLDVKDIGRTVGEHGERLRGVEESAKSAHHRIDEIVGIRNKGT